MPNNKEKEQMSLEELNQQFSRMRESGIDADKSSSESKEKKQNKTGSKTGIIVAVVVCLLLIGAACAAFVIFRGGRIGGGTGQNATTTVQSQEENADAGGDEQERESVLTDEEQEKWNTTDVNGEKVYVELNNKISVYSDTRAYIRLINPIFSNYLESIKIYTSDNPGNIFYQSEKLAPGTVLEAVNLKQPIKEEQSAVVEYTIYDSDGNEKGTYPVDVQFVPAETGKAN